MSEYKIPDRIYNEMQRTRIGELSYIAGKIMRRMDKEDAHRLGDDADAIMDIIIAETSNDHSAGEQFAILTLIVMSITCHMIEAAELAMLRCEIDEIEGNM